MTKAQRSAKWFHVGRQAKRIVNPNRREPVSVDDFIEDTINSVQNSKEIFL